MAALVVARYRYDVVKSTEKSPLEAIYKDALRYCSCIL